MPKKTKEEKDNIKEGRGLHVRNTYDAICDHMKENKNVMYTRTIRDIVILASALAVYKNYQPNELDTNTKVSTHKVPGTAIKSEHELFFKIIAFWKSYKYELLLDYSKLRVITEQFADAGFNELIKIYQESDNPNFELLKILSLES